MGASGLCRAYVSGCSSPAIGSTLTAHAYVSGSAFLRRMACDICIGLHPVSWRAVKARVASYARSLRRHGLGGRTCDRIIARTIAQVLFARGTEVRRPSTVTVLCPCARSHACCTLLLRQLGARPGIIARSHGLHCLGQSQPRLALARHHAVPEGLQVAIPRSMGRGAGRQGRDSWQR